MEKFAIDLDKVLDDFEFNEDCAEQIASVSPPVSNVSSSATKCNLEPSASKSYNYLMTDYGKTNKDYDIVSPVEKHKDLKHLNTDSRTINEKDTFGENVDYNKTESTLENTDSINDFYTHECVNDDKLAQKQTVVPCNSEQVSLTIYNDISQKLLQKQQNGSSSPKIDNRYDKKLNQPNVKPRVSNVFNSLNEYINAPPGSLDYVHSVLDKQDIGPNVESSVIQDENTITTKDVTVTHHAVVKNVMQNVNVRTVHEETNNSNSNIVTETFVPECENNVVVPVTLGIFVAQNTNAEKDNIKVIAVTNSKELECEKEVISNITVTAMNTNDVQYEYKDISVDTSVLNSQAHSTLNGKQSVISDTLHNSHVSQHENINDNEQEKILPPNSSDSTQESTNIQDQQIATVSETQSEHATRENVTEVHVIKNEANAQVKSCDTSNIPINTSRSVCKPFGFSNIDDLSEEELSKYLAELEEEEKLNENKSAEIAKNTTQSVSEERKDEDAHEAPIFENVIIGELPRISQEELSKKAKKFPVIDYSQEKVNEQTDFLERQKLQEYTNPTKSSFIESEGEAREETQKSIDSIISHTADSVTSGEFELPTTSEKSTLKCEESFTSEKLDAPNLKDIRTVQEHYTYDISSDQGSSNIKIETQSKRDNDIVLNPVQYNQQTELGMLSNVDRSKDDSNLPVQEIKTIDDSTKCITDTIPKSVGTSADTNITEINDELEKPIRPQTLDIVLADHTDDHQSLGSASVTPSDPPQSEIDGIKEDCQGSSPDALDNSVLESNSVLGKQPPFWVPDSDAPSCMLCEVKFTVLKRRHHCRACGKVLCNKCCSMKYKLEYQGNIDSRVCVSCYQLLTKAEAEQGMTDWSSGYTPYMSNNDINSPQGRQPNPNNPMEYCSTIPPLQQLAGGLPPPPTVMVPVGVLKREGGTKNRAEGSKSVMFSDGIRPGCDLTELDMSWDLKPPYRKPGTKRIPTPGSSLSSTTAKRHNLPRIDANTNSYVPQDPDALPPTVTIHKGQVSYHAVTDEGLLYKTLKNECEPPVMFAINRNLYAYVKITNLNCCVNKICWNVTSRGLACVGQDEVILLVETLPDETRIPKDLLIFINQLYIEAIKGNTMSELGFSLYQGANLLGSREHAGFLFIRQTLQCLQKIVLPPAPFLVGLLVHRWETPWAKVFPLRLLLRLGAEYRYYPCPLVSVRFRDALYFEIGHTVMKVLADFRNFGYTLPGVRGLTIHLRNRMTDVMFPRNRYDQVIKGLNNSNDHVLAYASNFSISADSHLVCIQTNTGDESSYQTQAINIHNKPRTVTGASFIVINGALKSSMGLSAKSSIVEDGLMVEIMPEKMEALKAALKNMQDFSIGCGKQGAPEPDETVNIKWVDNDVQFNLSVKSPIDGQLMDGIPSIRVHNGTDYKGTSRFIRWTEVFIIKSDDHPNGVHDPVDINKLSGNIAKATCTALVKLLDLLATAGLTKLGVRTTIHPDNVGYEAGSEGTKLPPIYMNSLDNELIQVLHKAAQSSQDTHTVLELIFYILDD